MRHGFRLLLDGLFTPGLLAGFRFLTLLLFLFRDMLFTLDLLLGLHLLAFSLLLFPFPLTLELFGPLAFHEVDMQRADLHKS